jgi:Protein of unknown function (DUF1161)
MRPTPFLRAAAAAAIGTAALAAVAQAPPAPTACDALRLRIEERIRANGVREPRVTVVEAAASAPGQVVGT